MDWVQNPESYCGQKQRQNSWGVSHKSHFHTTIDQLWRCSLPLTPRFFPHHGGLAFSHVLSLLIHRIVRKLLLRKPKKPPEGLLPFQIASFLLEATGQAFAFGPRLVDQNPALVPADRVRCGVLFGAGFALGLLSSWTLRTLRGAPETGGFRRRWCLVLGAFGAVDHTGHLCSLVIETCWD